MTAPTPHACRVTSRDVAAPPGSLVPGWGDLPGGVQPRRPVFSDHHSRAASSMHGYASPASAARRAGTYLSGWEPTSGAARVAPAFQALTFACAFGAQPWFRVNAQPVAKMRASTMEAAMQPAGESPALITRSRATRVAPGLPLSARGSSQSTPFPSAAASLLKSSVARRQAGSWSLLVHGRAAFDCRGQSSLRRFETADSPAITPLARDLGCKGHCAPEDTGTFTASSLGHCRPAVDAAAWKEHGCLVRAAPFFQALPVKTGAAHTQWPSGGRIRAERPEVRGEVTRSRDCVRPASSPFGMVPNAGGQSATGKLKETLPLKAYQRLFCQQRIAAAAAPGRETRRSYGRAG